MAARKTLTRMFGTSALFLLALVSAASAETKDSDVSLSGRIGGAERILIGIPENDVDVAGGEQFLVEIRKVLRGTGTAGKLARITNSGDEKQYPRYKAGKQYLFLLTKNTAGTGWINSGAAELPIEKNKVQLLVDGKVKEELSLAKIAELTGGSDSATERTATDGKWIVILSRQGSDIPIWLIEVKKGDGKNGDKAAGEYQARLIASPQDMSTSTLKEFSVTDSEVRLHFLADEETFEFRGKLDEGKVRGSLSIGEGGNISTSWLAPTEANKLPKQDEPQKTVGRDAFVEAASQENEAFEPLAKFVSRYPESPLALDAYAMMIQLIATQDNDHSKFKKLAEDYVRASAKWGSLLETKAHIDIGIIASRANVKGSLALDYLRMAEKMLTANSPQHWNMLIQSEIGNRLLASGQEAEGMTLLTKLHEENPFEEQLTWNLARLAEQKKDLDGAIALYADITALPMMEGMVIRTLTQGNEKFPREQFPSNALMRLWKEKNGDTNGLRHFIEEVYEKRLSGVAGPVQPPRKGNEGNRVVLCELLTGSACPPCVAADVATIALEATYAKSEVIVLRYHQHSPAPDPLANDDSGERYASYNAEGTPMIYVNGKLFPGAGGFMPQVPGIYRRLQRTVEPFLAETTSLQLDLSAKADNGRIAISAKASGLATFPEDVHLRLVLAEDKIPFIADNGIRYHEMIVRSMPGGADGIEPVKGQLAYQGEVDLAKLKAQLVKSLAKIENSMARPFASKPLDFKALHLVAFLQNDDTDEILQAAAIPVSGTLTIADEAPPAAPAKKAARTKAPAGN
jgi:hypothetical protein